MSSPTRAWLACLAVVAALVVVVPALTQEPAPRSAPSVHEPAAAQGAAAHADAECANAHPDAELVASFERSLAAARDLSARGSPSPPFVAPASDSGGGVLRANGHAPALAASGRAIGARRSPRPERVTLEAFVATALLRGIYRGKSYRAAVLNDELVQEGDELAPQLFVSAIGERHVLLELEGAVVRLDLPGARPDEAPPAAPVAPARAVERAEGDRQ